MSFATVALLQLKMYKGSSFATVYIFQPLPCLVPVVRSFSDFAIQRFCWDQSSVHRCNMQRWLARLVELRHFAACIKIFEKKFAAPNYFLKSAWVPCFDVIASNPASHSESRIHDFDSLEQKLSCFIQILLQSFRSCTFYFKVCSINYSLVIWLLLVILKEGLT